MGKVARRFSGLVIVIAGIGCSFESDGTNDSNELGSSMGTEPTASGSDTESGTSHASEGGEGSTSSVAGSTSVANDEPCVDSCAPTVPGGWNGPFHVVEAANPIDCPTGFARQDLGFSGLTAEASDCTCNCVEEVGDCRVDFELTITAACFGPLVSDTLEDGTCRAYEAVGANIRMRAEQAGAPVSCVADVITATPEATWASATTFCAAPARGGDCGSDVCIAQSPEGYATQLCISSEGDVECPGDGWSARTLVHRSFDDQRTCEGCTCSGPSTCDAQAFAYDSGSCGGTGQEVPLGACTNIAVSGSYSVSAVVDNGSCEASDVVPSGEATPSQAVTLCCAS
ncbi:MAG: hypothetical protein ACRBN8_20250 [Nannocystales bacterium]